MTSLHLLCCKTVVLGRVQNIPKELFCLDSLANVKRFPLFQSTYDSGTIRSHHGFLHSDINGHPFESPVGNFPGICCNPAGNCVCNFYRGGGKRNPNLHWKSNPRVVPANDEINPGPHVNLTPAINRAVINQQMLCC